MNSLTDIFHISWSNLVAYLPALLGGIVCFALSILTGHALSRFSTRYAMRHAKDPLIANFIGKVIWTVILILGTVLSLGILGLGTISNKILAGAGITTFVIGFALKDIGENFLAGIILAFSRPYHVGNLIECNGAKGIVRNMTMRQTTVEAENGKLILIPNSAILNNPLTKYLNDDNNLRQEFSLSTEHRELRKQMELIKTTISALPAIGLSNPQPPKVLIDSLAGDKVKLLVVYWFNKQNFNGSRSGSRTEVLMAVMDALTQAGFKYAG